MTRAEFAAEAAKEMQLAMDFTHVHMDEYLKAIRMDIAPSAEQMRLASEHFANAVALYAKAVWGPK